MRLIRFVLVFVSFLSLVGCAGFRSGEPLEENRWPLTGGENAVGLVVNATASVNGGSVDVAPARLEKLKEIVTTEVESSTILRVVDTSSASLFLDMTIDDRGEVSFLAAFLTGLTLYVIPSKTSDHFTITTEVRDRTGAILYAGEQQETVTMWQQLFLFPAVFFKNPITEINESIRDGIRRSIIEAKASGALQ